MLAMNSPYNSDGFFYSVHSGIAGQSFPFNLNPMGRERLKLTEDILSVLAQTVEEALKEEHRARRVGRVDRLEAAAKWIRSQQRRFSKKSEPTASMTPARRAWLTLLDTSGPQPRGNRQNAANACILLGWTEWDLSLPNGSQVTELKARELFGDSWLEYVSVNGCERITDAGREALRKERANV